MTTLKSPSTGLMYPVLPPINGEKIPSDSTSVQITADDSYGAGAMINPNFLSNMMRQSYIPSEVQKMQYDFKTSMENAINDVKTKAMEDMDRKLEERDVSHKRKLEERDEAHQRKLEERDEAHQHKLEERDEDRQRKLKEWDEDHQRETKKLKQEFVDERNKFSDKLQAGIRSSQLLSAVHCLEVKEELEKKINELENRLKCQICVVSEPNSRLPCGHLLCESCVDKLEKFSCPFCNQGFGLSPLRRVYYR